MPSKKSDNRNFRVAIILALALTFAGCGDGSENYDSGHSDGYAVGYNTACEIRATMISGDFGNEAYARGYSDGVTAGTMACNADRKAGSVR